MPPPDDWKPWVNPNQAGRPVGPGMQGRLTGNISLGGKQYPYASGGWKTPSVPYGEFPITPGQEGSKIRGRPGGGVSVAGSTGIFDPLLKRMRTGIALHATSSNDLDRMMTEGCFGVRKEDWPEFKRVLQEKMAREGQLTITLGEDGNAKIRSRLDKSFEDHAEDRRVDMADVAQSDDVVNAQGAVTDDDIDGDLDEAWELADEEDAVQQLDEEAADADEINAAEEAAHDEETMDAHSIE
jgi:hypothetical protein